MAYIGTMSMIRITILDATETIRENEQVEVRETRVLQTVADVVSYSSVDVEILMLQTLPLQLQSRSRRRQVQVKGDVTRNRSPSEG